MVEEGMGKRVRSLGYMIRLKQIDQRETSV